MTTILNYYEHRAGSYHSVVGDLRVLPEVYSPQLENSRDVLVWLPPTYHVSEHRYPVLYMHDGQNLFDRGTGFMGMEWEVDETMLTLADSGYEAIIVGLPNMGEARLAEYNPFPSKRWPARGANYIRFITDTVKPLIDEHFRTRAEREHTGLFGSSMGGLISLYGFFSRPDVFGLCGAMSPSLFMGRGGIYRAVKFVGGRIYLDNGTREPSAEGMRDALVNAGYTPRRDLRYTVGRGHQHTESAWAKRLPRALKFLLQKSKQRKPKSPIG